MGYKGAVRVRSALLFLFIIKMKMIREGLMNNNEAQ